MHPTVDSHNRAAMRRPAWTVRTLRTDAASHGPSFGTRTRRTPSLAAVRPHLRLPTWHGCSMTCALPWPSFHVLGAIDRTCTTCRSRNRTNTPSPRPIRDGRGRTNPSLTNARMGAQQRPHHHAGEIVPMEKRRGGCASQSERLSSGSSKENTTASDRLCTRRSNLRKARSEGSSSEEETSWESNGSPWPETTERRKFPPRPPSEPKPKACTAACTSLNVVSSLSDIKRSRARVNSLRNSS
mmetsp:Transcript_1886/g.11355  ORF Transcript_1886/g.11355 Transcript_1886/m.11355 type:complete len:241 (+) Transcript_1886:4919-5641(+)